MSLHGTDDTIQSRSTIQTIKKYIKLWTTFPLFSISLMCWQCSSRRGNVGWGRWGRAGKVHAGGWPTTRPGSWLSYYSERLSITAATKLILTWARITKKHSQTSSLYAANKTTTLLNKSQCQIRSTRNRTKCSKQWENCAAPPLG